jgi:hypothetical protein
LNTYLLVFKIKAEQIEENAGDLPSSGSKALKKVSIRSKSLHLLANILKTIIDRENLCLLKCSVNEALQEANNFNTCNPIPGR